MIVVESASVPSQSNTSSRKRLGADGLSRGIAFLGRVQPYDERREIGRQRGFEPELSRLRWMWQREAPRVQEHPFETLLRQRLVPGEVTVLVVPCQREIEMREMNADLMRAAGVQFGFEQAHRRRNVGPDLAPMEHRPRGLPAVVLDAEL